VIRTRQPYNPRYEWLGHLAVLTRQNKHHRLTPQLRDETRHVYVKTDDFELIYRPDQWEKGGVGVADGDVHIGGVPVDPATEKPIPSPQQRVTEHILVDWQFDDPRVSALGTLHQIQAGLPTLIHDVLSACGL
jgi:hypothetical protein